MIARLLPAGALFLGACLWHDAGLLERADGSRVAWDRLPLRVIHDDDAGHVDQAIRWLEDRLGFDAFEVVDREPADVRIASDEPISRSYARHEYSDEGHRVDIALSYQLHGQCRMLVAQHELGHALGLAHDEWRGSIMYPDPCHTVASITDEPREFDAPWRWPAWLSDEDVDLLREAYR